MAVQKTSFTFPSGSKTPTDIYCHVLQDDSKTPIGVIQFIHGLTEYSGIFRDIARFLAEQGYICGFLGIGPTLVHRHLKKAGKKTELKLYMKAMHEPFAERGIQNEFFGDVLDFFNRNNPLVS